MILFDFDGTIVDLWPRFHAVFCDLTNAKVDLETYRVLKQRFKKDELLMRHLNLKLPSDYFVKKALFLEQIDYLKYDQLLLPKKTLLDFTESHDVRILTARRNPENFFWELNHLGISQLRSQSVCVNIPKSSWISENISEQTLIVGDDIKDLQSAELPNCIAAMVLTGMGCSKDFLETGLSHEVFPSLKAFIHSRIPDSHLTIPK